MNLESVIKQQTDYIWQDREIKFDCKTILLNCRRGETIIGELLQLSFRCSFMMINYLFNNDIFIMNTKHMKI